MMAAFADGLIWPAATLAFLGWLVPRLLSLVFPEGVRPLLMLALCAALVMLALGMAFFAGLYLWQGVTWDILLEAGWPALVAHFLRLGP